MQIQEFYKIIDAYAPKSLSDDYCARYGAYDNSGILVDTGDEIKKALFSLDLSFGAIQKAVAEKVNLIVTHHPAIYGKIGDIAFSDFEPLGEKLITCIKKGISVVSMHLNLDCAKDGIDESLATAISGGGLKNASIMHSLNENGYGYGRAYDIAPQTLGELVERLQGALRTEQITVYGNKDKEITRIASFCGGGADEQAVAFAIAQGAQAIVSSDFKHHILTLATEKGLSVIALTHYASENYGFEKYYQKILKSVELPCVYHTDENML